MKRVDSHAYMLPCETPGFSVNYRLKNLAKWQPVLEISLTKMGISA